MRCTAHRNNVSELVPRVSPTAMPRSTSPFLYLTQPWYDMWPEMPKHGPTGERVSSHSRQDHSAPQHRTPTRNTASCAADWPRILDGQGRGQALSRSRTRPPGRSRKSLPHSSDNVSERRRGAKREHRRLAHAGSAVSSQLIAHVEPRWIRSTSGSQ